MNANERLIRERWPALLTLEGAYHGKSTLARSTLGDEAQRGPLALGPL